MNLAFLIRADKESGLGHLMRCLAIYEAFKDKPIQSHFYIETFDSAYTRRFLPEHVNVTFFSADSRVSLERAEDVHQTETLDYLIVDRYGTDVKYLSTLSLAYHQLVELTDDHTIQLPSDIVINVNPNARVRDYNTDSCSSVFVLAGRAFTLFRKEWIELRDKMESVKTSSRQSHVKKTILINLGGTDNDDLVLSMVMAIVSQNRLIKHHHLLELNAVVFNAERFETLKQKTDILNIYAAPVSTPKMMAQSDFVITAAGTMMWERCFLGKQGLSIGIVDNQRENVRTAQNMGVSVLAVDDTPFDLNEQVIEHLAAYLNRSSEENTDIEHQLTSHFDGLGSRRICAWLSRSHNPQVILRQANVEDVWQVYAWQMEEGARTYSFTNIPPSSEEHQDWFQDGLKNENRNIFIVEWGGVPIAMVRADKTEEYSRYLVSILISWGFRSQGLGPQILKKLISLYPNKLIARIKPENKASIDAFKRAGFVWYKEDQYIA